MTNSPRLSATSVDAAAAAQIARDLYGWDGLAEPLPGERDSNFLISRGEGERMVLKIANRADGASSVAMQVRALEHLSDTALLVPRVVTSLTRETSAEVRVPGSEPREAWAISFLDGIPLALVAHHDNSLLREVGRTAAELSKALATFTHPALERVFHWDLARGVETVRKHRAHISDAEVGGAVDLLVARAEQVLKQVGHKLPRGATHNDMNDYNLLVSLAEGGSYRVGVIDFGDMVHTFRVSDLAVALTYVMLDKEEPLAAAAEVVRGFHAECPLNEDEANVLFALACLRACMSLALGAFQREQQPSNEYLGISTDPMQRLVGAMARVPLGLAVGVMRRACGYEVSPASGRVRSWLDKNVSSFSPLLDVDLRSEPCAVLDLGVSSPLVSGDAGQNTAEHITPRIFGFMRDAGAAVAIGRYDEPRLLYVAPFFALGSDANARRRTIHVGLDIFAAAGTHVHAPLGGTVHAFAENATLQDYGPVIVLKHMTGDGDEFFSIYGHLSRESLRGLEVGREISRGQKFAALGTPEENLGWTPHLHLQLATDLFGLGTDFPGVVEASLRDVWLGFCPDPNLLVGIPAGRLKPCVPPHEELLRARRRTIGGSVKLGYADPVQMRRGWKQYLYDEVGRRYIDAYNNVPHVGHSHPRVVRAVSQQLSVLNTNTRYLSELQSEYAIRLCATLPPTLEVCFFVNSGSEANELALRLARAHTGHRETIVLESAYHGNTGTAVDISPYKHAGPGGSGPPPWVHVAPQPDVYRGEFRGDAAAAAPAYASRVRSIIQSLERNGLGLSAFIAETCPSVGGQIIPPRGYFAEVYKHVRNAGGVCIADEVQTGFGRMGDHFWAFEAYGVVPDILVLGKPIGNGYPIGAVVTTSEIANSFNNGMEFFSTFGGSSASCAAGLAVLDVLRDEGLQAHALRVGAYLGAQLRELAARHEIVGDVRGSGLFWGVELVRDRVSLSPATGEAARVAERMKDLGVLIGTDGPYHNVLKIRPPMPFDAGNADALVTRLDTLLRSI